MKIVQFTYTKPTGQVSERTLIPLVEPSEGYYAGIDVSELDMDTFADFALEYELASKRHIEELKAIQDKYDLAYSYRKFLTSRMTNTKTDNI